MKAEVVRPETYFHQKKKNFGWGMNEIILYFVMFCSSRKSAAQQAMPQYLSPITQHMKVWMLVKGQNRDQPGLPSG